MEDEKNFVGLQSSKLNFNDIIEIVVSPNCGAVSTFIGTTRDNFEEKKVVKLEYEAYEPMAVKEMQVICKKIRSLWDVEKIAIYHRLGEVPVTEASIIIAISSPHRQESLKAVEFAINTLKTSVPIWKKEVYENDEPQWKANKECLWAKNDRQEVLGKKHEMKNINLEDNNTNETICEKINVKDNEASEIKPSIANDNSNDSLDNSDQSITDFEDLSQNQIKRNTNEMFSRIESFCLNKSEKANSLKLEENFSLSSYQNDDDDESCVCSRVNMIWTKHKNSKNRGEVCRVYNQWKHQNIKSDSGPEETESSDYPPALEERLTSNEKILGINKPVPRDVYERIKKIEDRILFLESISPEYKNLWTNMNESTKSLDENIHHKSQRNTQAIRKRTYSSAEIDSKLHELEDRYGKRFR